jgi:GR25 family glycosyltransferase involved in LPS biosynthesis
MTTQVYYINLDHRKDRRDHIERQLGMIGMPATRISAVYQPTRGYIGCAKSHVLAVSAFLRSGATYGIILEDDFTFRNPEQAKEQFRSLFKSDVNWDLVMLAGNIINAENGPVPFLRRVFNGQTTSGYLVKRSFAQTLLANFKECVDLLERHQMLFRRKKSDYCIDMYWKRLQQGSRWFIFEPAMGYQAESYSDIERIVVKYNV